MISLKRLLSPIVTFCFITIFIAQSLPIYGAQTSLLNLPQPGQMISLSPKFVPAHIKGISIYPNDPFKFDFIIDTGDMKLNDQQFKDEANKLIQYFMAALTVPEKEDWVNLSPYEKDRIIPESLGVTEMGRDMLAQDYILKQLTSSLIYPEKQIGKEFWSKVYVQAQKQFGTTNIPVNTFNKVWIVPSQAVVWEHDNSAYVVRSHLKVMLEQDYLSLNKHLNNNIFSGSGMDQQDANTTNAVGSNVVREVVLPALEKEVNEGANFAALRQVFNSAILAAWYKQNLKQTILGQVYANQDKVTGVDLADKQIKQKIYERYLQAFKKGAFNFIKEDNDPMTHQPVSRKYFSGGVTDLAMVTDVERGNFAQLPSADQGTIVEGTNNRVTVDMVQASASANMAMLAAEPESFEAAVQTKRKPVVGYNMKGALLTADVDAFLDGIAADYKADPVDQNSVDVIAIFAEGDLKQARAKIDQLVKDGIIPKGFIKLGAQNIRTQGLGAFTAHAPSIVQLKNWGVEAVLLGHSEIATQDRGESTYVEGNELIAQKLKIVVDSGLRPILAYGETMSENAAGQTKEVLTRQLKVRLGSVTPEQMISSQLVLAYEPVWAIGNAKPATKEVAEEFIGLSRQIIFDTEGYAVAANTPIEYGGSMSATNVDELSDQPNIDGGLIGGASTKWDTAVPIYRNFAKKFADQAMLTQLEDANLRADRFMQGSNIEIALELTRSGLRGGYQRVEDILGKGEKGKGWTLLKVQLLALKEYYAELEADFRERFTANDDYLSKAVKLLDSKKEGDILTEKEQNSILRGSIKKTADTIAAHTRQTLRDKYGVISILRFVEGISDGVMDAGRAGIIALPSYLESDRQEIEKAIQDAIEQKQDMKIIKLKGTIYPIIEEGDDDLEGTDAFVDNPQNPESWFSGSTSVSAYGLGVGSLKGLGFIPDEAYAGQFLANMGNAKDADEFKQIEVEEMNRHDQIQVFHLYDPELYALNPDRFIEVLKFKAKKKFGDDSKESLAKLKVAVTVMDRPTEAQFIKALERMQAGDFKGLQIVKIKAGSVAHGKKALMTHEQFEAEYKRSYGDEDVILLSRVGPVEAALNMVDAKLFEETGAVGAMRIFSGNMQNIPGGPVGQYMGNQNRRYEFTDGAEDPQDDEVKMITALRQETGDAKEILEGNKVFTTADIPDHVKTSATVIVGSPFLGQPGVKEISSVDDRLVVRVISTASENGKLKFSVFEHPAAEQMFTPVRIAINGGSGRIGTNLLRAILESRYNLNVVALNSRSFSSLKSQKDLGDFIRLIRTEFSKSDAQDVRKAEIKGDKDEEGWWIQINGGEKIRLIGEPNPEKLPWKKLNIDVVYEATGQFNDPEKARLHLDAGAKKVVISSPSTDEVPTIVAGINSEILSKDTNLCSAGSCTTGSIAPPLKVIDDTFGIKNFYIVTTHSYTSDQAIHPHLRVGKQQRGMAAAENIIPTSTGAAKAIGLVLPALKGKGEGKANRVPTSNGSLTDITLITDRDVTVQEVNDALRNAANGSLKGIMAVEEGDQISSEILGRPESSIIQLNGTKVLGGRMVTIAAWYDNEFGYSNRAVDLGALLTKAGLRPGDTDYYRREIPPTIEEHIKADNAMAADNLNVNGGINLDANLYNMQVLHDGNGMILPVSQQPIGQFMKIKGFKPVFLNIERNINLPARLGVSLNKAPQ